MWKDTLKDAVEKAGGMSRTARAIGVPTTTLQYWLTHRRTPYPAEYVIPLEELSGVSRHDLRPDIFGPAPTEAAE